MEIPSCFFATRIFFNNFRTVADSHGGESGAMIMLSSVDDVP